jgi:hypothetical protein
MCVSLKSVEDQDVTAKRGANVASYHHLLVARLKLKKNWTGEICHAI